MTIKTVTKTNDEATALFCDLDKPSLHALSYALRHPDTWPKDFVWDFGKCTQCAMGLAHHLWGEMIPQVGTTNGASVMAREFGMKYEAADRIFLRQRGKTKWLFGLRDAIPDMDRITPEMVADQIDSYLVSAE